MNNKKGISSATYSEKQLILYRVLFLIAGIFMIAAGLLLMLVSLAFGISVIIGILEIRASNKFKKMLIEKRQSADFTDSIANTNTDILSKIAEETNSTNTTAFKSERHKVAGTSYKQKEIKSLGIENTDYTLTKKEIIECGMEDEKIYQLIFSPLSVQLIEEPENEYDPNAIKVIIDNVHIGYIKKGSCSHVKKLIRENKIRNISADIYGGKYKLVSSNYDSYTDKESFTLESGNTDFFVSIQLEV